MFTATATVTATATATATMLTRCQSFHGTHEKQNALLGACTPAEPVGRLPGRGDQKERVHRAKLGRKERRMTDPELLTACQGMRAPAPQQATGDAWQGQVQNDRNEVDGLPGDACA